MKHYFRTTYRHYLVNLERFYLTVMHIYYFLQIKEKVIEYSENSNCGGCKSNLSSVPIGNPSNCSCHVEFSLDEEWSGDVYFYYRLTNFYQVKS